MKDRWSILISWTAVLLWMILIFRLSSQVAVQSDTLSRGIIGMIMGVFGRVSLELNLDVNMLNHLLRKCAHFTAYLVLGVLVINAMRNSRLQGSRWMIAAFVICVLYAVSDEVHQLFVPGRGGQFIDVLIDSTGSFVGIGLYGVASKIRKLHRLEVRPMSE